MFIALISSSFSRNSLVMLRFFCSGKPSLTYHVLSIPKQASFMSVALVSILFFSPNCFSNYSSLYILPAVASTSHSSTSSSSWSNWPLDYIRLRYYLALSRVSSSCLSYACLFLSSSSYIFRSSITASNYFFLLSPSTSLMYLGSSWKFSLSMFRYFISYL